MDIEVLARAGQRAGTFGDLAEHGIEIEAGANAQAGGAELSTGPVQGSRLDYHGRMRMNRWKTALAVSPGRSPGTRTAAAKLADGQAGMPGSMHRALVNCLAALGVIACSSVALADPPHIRTGGVSTDWSQAACLQNVEKVVRSLGFSRDLDVDSNDVEAHNGTYSTETICFRGGFVFVIVAGPNFGKAGELRDAIWRGLQALR